MGHAGEIHCMDREDNHPKHGVTKVTGEDNCSNRTWNEFIKKEVVVHKDWHRHYGKQYEKDFGIQASGRDTFGRITPELPSRSSSRASRPSSSSRPRTAQSYSERGSSRGVTVNSAVLGCVFTGWGRRTRWT